MGGVSTGAFIRGVSGVPDSALLFQSAIPFILAGGTATNQFTVNSTGLVTALPTLPITSGFAFFYLPSGVTGTAGWYYAQVVSATSVQLYTARYTTGDPRLAVPTVLVVQSTTAGNYSQTVGSQITGYQITVPGGSMGPNGSIRTHHWVNFRSITTQNVFGARFGSLVSNEYLGQGIGDNSPNIGIQSYLISVINNNNAARQYAPAFAGDTTNVSNITPAYFTTNTAVDFPLTNYMQLGNAAALMIAVGVRIELFYGA